MLSMPEAWTSVCIVLAAYRRPHSGADSQRDTATRGGRGRRDCGSAAAECGPVLARPALPCHPRCAGAVRGGHVGGPRPLAAGALVGVYQAAQALDYRHVRCTHRKCSQSGYSKLFEKHSKTCTPFTSYKIWKVYCNMCVIKRMCMLYIIPVQHGVAQHTEYTTCAATNCACSLCLLSHDPGAGPVDEQRCGCGCSLRVRDCSHAPGPVALPGGRRIHCWPGRCVMGHVVGLLACHASIVR